MVFKRSKHFFPSVTFEIGFEYSINVGVTYFAFVSEKSNNLCVAVIIIPGAMSDAPPKNSIESRFPGVFLYRIQACGHSPN